MTWIIGPLFLNRLELIEKEILMAHISTIDFRSLQKRFREPLVFSIVESLEPGSCLTVVHNQDFTDLKKQLASVGLDDISITAKQDGPELWTLTLKKQELDAQEHGCCGVCGGHDHR